MAFNTLVSSYTAARAAWLTYRGAVAANQPAADYFTQLNRNLLDLSNAIHAFAGSAAANARQPSMIGGQMNTDLDRNRRHDMSGATILLPDEIERFTDVFMLALAISTKAHSATAAAGI